RGARRGGLSGRRPRSPHASAAARPHGCHKNKSLRTSYSVRAAPRATRETERGLGEIYDLIGIGCGPANLALGACLQDAAESTGGCDLRWPPLEAKPHFAWHPGLLLENASIQNSVLKDLALIRDPRSRFTFLNYLKEKGRLFEFLNLRDLYPSRI